MKTTIDIADALLRRAKKEAARRGLTLRAVIEEALRNHLEGSRGAARPFRLEKRHVKGKGLQPGIRAGDWSRIRELAYEGRGG